MGTITDAFGRHHKHCDDLWVQAEDAVVSERWADAAALWRKFTDAMELHLGSEESALFPAFEAATGMVSGPTTVMRMEHEQLRSLFSELAQALRERNSDAFSGAAQTLLILMQQHNMKEENMLYPMCDRALEADRPLIDRLQAGLTAA